MTLTCSPITLVLNLNHIVMKRNKEYSAFTIIELLVVIVVIGILAAITLIAYNGMISKATVASLSSDLDNASKQLKLAQITNSVYPTTIDCSQSDSSTNKCLKSSNGTTYQYVFNNSDTAPGFCVTATNGTTTYKITEKTTPSAGDCLSYGLVINLDAGDTASYPGSGTTWTDLSGNGNNGTLYNGVSYSSANSGILVFDGVDDYATVPGVRFSPSTSFTVSGFFKRNSLSTMNSATIFRTTNLNAGRLIFGVIDEATNYGIIDNNTYFGSSNGDYWEMATNNYKNTNWVYLTMVHDKTNLWQKTYLNAVDIENDALSGGYDNPASLFVIGKGNASTYAYVSLGTLSVHNRALSSSEITQQFNALRGRYGL
jgi:prepilin-type N-terminal cleavage/methylation domain-containing protein